MSNEYRWLTPESQQFLERGYLLPGQTVDERIDIICNKAGKILGMPDFAAKFKENIQKGWYSISTPIWVNFGNDRGYPISCFGSNIEDSMESILSTYAEVGTMTKNGGGTSAYFGKLRGRGKPIRNNGESSGSVHFMQAFDSLIGVISQGSARRGQFAAYLPIEHDDIEEFLTIRGEGSPIKDISTGITVTDDWMESMIAGDKDKRKIWAKVLQTRMNTGYPYIMFVDTANTNKPDVYKDMSITHSNLCSEIMLPDNEEESFVCDLSSMNITYYEEWKDTDAVDMLVFFLDAVMSEFIDKSKDVKFMERARRFAINHRALGIGWFGYHDYLINNMIPYESLKAKLKNVEIAKNIQQAAYRGSAKLASILGECKITAGFGIRNATLTAIAPTKSSALIIGNASENVEPHLAMIYTKDLQKIKFTYKNPKLISVLEERGFNNNETWKSILENGGSVQHLTCLSELEKSVFKTFREISPMEVIIQAAQRQRYICQSQSLNLIIPASTSAKELNSLIIEAWKLGVKTLYYQINENAAQELSRNILACSSCEA